MQSIKYDPDQWVDLKATKDAPCPAETHIRLASPGTVSVDLGSGWRVIGHGSEFKISLPNAGKIKADKDYSLFVSIDTTVEQIGVPLTNFDKRPGMSSIEKMIKAQFLEKALKDKLKANQRLEADRKTNQDRVDKGLQDENPIAPEPEPPVVEPTPDPEPASAAE